MLALIAGQGRLPDYVARHAEGPVTIAALEGFPPDHPYSHLLRLKDVIFSRRLSDRDVYSADLPKRIARDLNAARPVFLMLDKLAGVPAHLD